MLNNILGKEPKIFIVLGRVNIVIYSYTLEYLVIHSYNKTTKRNSNYHIKNNYLFLWFIPVLVSAYLFLNSPNLIKEIKNEQIDDSKITNIKNVLDNLKNKEQSYKREMVIKDSEDTNSDYLTDVNKDKDKDASTTDYNSKKEANNVKLYLFEFIDDKVKLARLPYKFDKSNNSDLLEVREENTENSIINESIERLINPPLIYKSRYQSLIPAGTKLIGFHLKDGLLTLNFNEELLNNYYGEEGNRLKIDQIVSTMTSIPYVDKVVFHIEGKKVRYLDRDGLVINKTFVANDLFKNSFVQYVD